MRRAVSLSIFFVTQISWKEEARKFRPLFSDKILKISTFN